MSYFDPNGEPNPDLPEPVPSGNQPRWTVDEKMLVLHGRRSFGQPCPFYFSVSDLDQMTDNEFDALVAAVRSAAEVPALRERVAQVEAERTEWFATVDRLAEERDQLLDTSNHRGAVISLQRQRDQLTERLAAAEAVIRRLLDHNTRPTTEQRWFILGGNPGDDRYESMTNAEADVIARAQGEQE